MPSLEAAEQLLKYCVRRGVVSEDYLQHSILSLCSKFHLTFFFFPIRQT